MNIEYRVGPRLSVLRKLGLANLGIDAAAGVKSSDYGVFGRGPGGHIQGEPDSDADQ